jgi:hypothetical protein
MIGLSVSSPADENVLVALYGNVLGRGPALFLADVAPQLVKLQAANVKVAHDAVMDAGAALADTDAKPHDRIAVTPVRRSVARMLTPSQRAEMASICFSRGRGFLTCPIRQGEGAKQRGGILIPKSLYWSNRVIATGPNPWVDDRGLCCFQQPWPHLNPGFWGPGFEPGLPRL